MDFVFLKNLKSMEIYHNYNKVKTQMMILGKNAALL